MKDTKHTPGPWKVRFINPINPSEGDFFVEAKNNNMPNLGYGIEILGDDYGKHNGYPREQRLADAKLIAAAPKLLSLLKKLMNAHLGPADKAELLIEAGSLIIDIEK